MSTPKKKAKKKAPVKRKKKPASRIDKSVQNTSPEFDPTKLSDQRPFMLENKYAGRGRPALYDSPDALHEECERYFEWLKGVYYDKETEKEVEKYNKRTRKYDTKKVQQVDRIWIRMPEPPTITGLVLFLGYAHRQSLHDQIERGPEFSDVITRAIARVEQGYEIDLRDRDKSKGAQFALPNIGNRHGWRNTQSVQNLDANGKPADPPKGVVVQVGSIAPNIDKNL